MADHKFFDLLNIEDDEQFKLAVMEAIGSLVLTVHWLRGTFNWMMHTGAVKWPSAEDEANYKRLFENIELYESFVWEIAPARAAVVQLREYRRTGQLMENYDKLFIKEAHGRLPFDLSKDELDDIKDILRRLGQARLAADMGVREGVDTRK